MRARTLAQAHTQTRTHDAHRRTGPFVYQPGQGERVAHLSCFAWSPGRLVCSPRLVAWSLLTLHLEYQDVSGMVARGADSATIVTAW